MWDRLLLRTREATGLVGAHQPPAARESVHAQTGLQVSLSLSLLYARRCGFVHVHVRLLLLCGFLDNVLKSDQTSASILAPVVVC